MINIKEITYINCLGKRVSLGNKVEQILADDIKNYIEKKYWKSQTRFVIEVI